MTSTAAPRGRSRLRSLGLPVALFVAVAAYALLMAPSVSLWNDEAITLSAADRSPSQLWGLLQRVDAVHGAYYAFMTGWTELFGASPLAARLPSALAAAGTALGVLFLTKLVASSATAYTAAIVCATLPRMTWAGIEARPFVFSALIATWATWALVRAVHGSRAARWVLYGGLAALGILVNIYLVLLVAAHLVTVLVVARRERNVIVGFLVAGAAAGLATAPLLLLARAQQGQLGSSGDRGVLSILRKVIVNQLFLGETPSAVAAAPWFTRAWQVAAIVAAALGLCAIVLALIRRAAPGDDKRWVLAIAVPWLVLPTVVIAGYAIAIAPLYQPRYLTFAAPAGAMLIAAGLRSLGRRWYATLAVVVYVLAVLVVFASQRIPFAKSGSDWGAVARIVAENAESGDAVYFAPRSSGASEDGLVTHTTRRIEAAYPDAFAHLDDVTLQQTGAETNTFDGFSRTLDAAQSELDSHARVWAVFSKKAADDVYDSDDELLRALGYTGEIRWSGPSTVVVEYTR